MSNLAQSSKSFLCYNVCSPDGFAKGDRERNIKLSDNDRMIASFVQRNDTSEFMKQVRV